MRKKKSIAKKRNPPSHDSPNSKVIAQRTTRISGPLPSADEMAKYDAISPTIVGRIIDLAESEADHRRLMDRKIVTYQGREVILGQLCGLTVALGGFALSGYAFYLGHPGWAVGIVGGVLASLVGAFIKGRSKETG